MRWCVGEGTGEVVCVGEGTGEVVCGRGASEGEAMECGRERVRVKGRWVRGGESEGDITTK